MVGQWYSTMAHDLHTLGRVVPTHALPKTFYGALNDLHDKWNNHPYRIRITYTLMAHPDDKRIPLLDIVSISASFVDIEDIRKTINAQLAALARQYGIAIRFQCGASVRRRLEKQFQINMRTVVGRTNHDGSTVWFVYLEPNPWST